MPTTAENLARWHAHIKNPNHQALWDMLKDNACFESDWSASLLPCLLGPDCWVRGNLNALAQALEQGGAREAGERWLHPSDRSKAQRGLALFLQHNPIPSA